MCDGRRWRDGGSGGLAGGWVEGGERPLADDSRVHRSINHLEVCVREREIVGFSPGSVGVCSVFGRQSQQIHSKTPF